MWDLPRPDDLRDSRIDGVGVRGGGGDDDRGVDPCVQLTGLRPSPTRRVFGRRCLGAPVGG